MSDVFEGFCWHSAIGIDDTLDGNRQFVTRLPNTPRARTAFVASREDSSVLIHKTSRALWRVSPDKKSIEPVFSSEILTDDDIKSLDAGADEE